MKRFTFETFNAAEKTFGIYDNYLNKFIKNSPVMDEDSIICKYDDILHMMNIEHEEYIAEQVRCGNFELY
jgi:hypothetical protein